MNRINNKIYIGKDANSVCLPIFYFNLLALFCALILVGCSSNNDSDRIKQLEKKISALENEKQTNEKIKPILINENIETINTNEISYNVGDPEEFVLSIQGEPTSLNDFNSLKVYSFGSSTLTFKNGVLNSFSNIDRNLKISSGNQKPKIQESVDKSPSIISSSKFCYVYIRTSEPELEFVSGPYSSSEIPKPLSFIYKSSVVEIKNYSEDEKYKLMDEFEQQIRSDFAIKNMQLKGKAECKILENECFVFKTYKQASEHKRNH